MNMSSLPLAIGDKWRPKLHFSASRQWLNDPNGLVFYQGIYHLYYQTNPAGSHWADMHWGHARSSNLLDWEQLRVALDAEPDGLGYAFSGGAVVDWRNSSGLGDGREPPLVATYTQHSQLGVQVQSLAVSRDGGMRFDPYVANPIIPNPGLTDFRDPKVIWYEPGNFWVMALVAGDCVHFYRSANLRDWQLLSLFGKAQGAHSGVWECPDLFPLCCPQTGRERWVLLVSVNSGGPAGGSATQYFVGDFNGCEFIPEHSDIRWLDYGPDCYAGITWDGLPTGERILIAWMSNWQYASQTPTQGWRGAMTLPRQLNLLSCEGSYRLASLPIAGLEARRGEPFLLVDEDCIAPVAMDFSETLPEVFELVLSLQPGREPVLARWRLSNATGEYLDLVLDTGKAELQLDRRHSGWDQQGFGRVVTAPLPPANRQLKLRILVDACSVEVFVDEGYNCLTALCFPSRAFSHLGFSLEAGAVQSCRCVCYGLTGNTQAFAGPDYVAGDDKILA